MGALQRCGGVEVIEVRTLAELESIDGLILPGGESTTIARLLIAFELFAPLQQRLRDGLPAWGTCAGAILLAANVPALDRPPLGAIDMTVDRNAFGRQIDSFEADISIAGVPGGPVHAVFIRAPVIASVGPGVEVLAQLPDGRIVACRQGRCLASSFHPELTNDLRMHRAFIELVREVNAQPLAADGKTR